MSKLSQFFTEKAKNLYGEDESRKSQSLAQFREWIKKHPFITGFNPTDSHLLAHLRSCKYSMANAFEQLERCLIFIKTHESWFNMSDEEHERALQLYESGFLRVLKRRDSEGRLNFVVSSNLADPNKFTGDDVMNLNCIIFPILISQEETQISGINYINSCKNVTVNHIPLLSLKKTAEGLSNLKSFPLSAKNIFIIGVPQFGTQILMMLKYILSEKLRSRFHVLNDFSDLPEEIEKSLSSDDNEEVEDIRELIKTYQEKVKRIFEFEIDLEKAAALSKTFENTGSFRKLEID